LQLREKRQRNNRGKTSGERGRVRGKINEGDKRITKNTYTIFSKVKGAFNGEREGGHTPSGAQENETPINSF